MKAMPFLQQYPGPVFSLASQLREVILEKLPDVTEQVDLAAKMVAYVYGPKYTDTICVMIPSKKGLKLGFYKGIELPDPDQLLAGSGKISRYAVIKNQEDVYNPALKSLLDDALKAYKQRSQH